MYTYIYIYQSLNIVIDIDYMKKHKGKINS